MSFDFVFKVQCYNYLFLLNGAYFSIKFLFPLITVIFNPVFYFSFSDS